MKNYRPKVIVTKIGMDGHDRGSRVVATHLRDAGMEVVYTPPWQSVSAVVRLAEEEDADVIGVSCLATDHLLVPDLIQALNDSQMEHIRVIVGGIVPPEDETELLNQGVSRIFHPGASLSDIASEVRELAQAARLEANQMWEENNP